MVSQRLSDHNAIQCLLNVSRPQRQFTTVSFRPYSRINIEPFAADLSSLPLIQQPADDLDDLVRQYDEGIACRRKSWTDTHPCVQSVSSSVGLPRG